MNNQAKILAFAGMTSSNSLNKKLVKIAAQGAQIAGGEVTYLDLQQFESKYNTKPGVGAQAPHG